MRMYVRIHWLVLVVFFFGCAATPKTVYFSRPEMLNVSNEIYSVQVKPIKLDNPFYVGFQLTLQNKSDRELFINWNGTRYVYNGKKQGRVVFKGVDPEAVKNGIPSEKIAPGETLSKPIYPIKKLGFMRKRDRPNAGGQNFFPGILPNGKNSVLLAVQQGDRRWRELLTFNFEAKQVQ